MEHYKAFYVSADYDQLKKRDQERTVSEVQRIKLTTTLTK